MDKKLILLVEDSDDDAVLFQHAVARSQCEAAVHHVEATEEAIHCIQAGMRPSLVFLDLMLPNIGGVHFLQWVRQQEEFRCIPVIVMTGAIQRQTMTDLCSMGVNAVMVKPLSQALLHEAVSAACTFWLKFCVPPRGTSGD